MSTPTVTLLAGGVGGAKAAEGLAKSRYAQNLSIIGNIGDDQSFYGLWVSPDIDTLTYTLSNQIDRQQGWGLKDDSHRVQARLAQFGCANWMSLGDLDLATHIYRTNQRQTGVRPQLIAQAIAKSFGVQAQIILPTDDVVATRLETELGWLDFQDYFVAQRCEPTLTQICYHKAEQAQPTPESLAAIDRADIIAIAPSNPLLSIGAILAIPHIKTQIQVKRAPVVAVSPLIGGKAIKGPAAKILSELGIRPDALGIANYYRDLIDVLVIDSSDYHLKAEIEALGIEVHCHPILMMTEQEKVSVMEFAIARGLEHQQARLCA